MTNNFNKNMENQQPSLVTQVQFASVAGRIKILGMSIMFGLIVIYIAGIVVSDNNVNKDLAILNLISLIICPLFCISSVYIKKILSKSVTAENFKTKYFSSHIIAFALCDAGALFCIATNLFINQNIIYASFGLLIAIIYIWINLPKEDDLKKFSLGGRVQSFE